MIQKNKNTVKSINRNVRSSPRKVNILLKHIRGKKADVAIRDLSFAKQRVAMDIKKTVQAAIANAEESPVGLLMPKQSFLYTGRVHACSQLHNMVHLARELCGGQICVTPDYADFHNADTQPWLKKFYTINDNWSSEDRRRLLAFGRDLLNSSNAGHKLTFQLFAQSPPFAHLNAVYNNFDFTGPLDFVKRSAGLSDSVMK